VRRWVANSVGAALVGAFAIHACGGKAVIDEESGGGQGGNGGALGGGGVQSPLCSTPSPVGRLFACVAPGGPGAGLPCDRSVCDDSGNNWTTSCEGDGCLCEFNNQVRCNCVRDDGGDYCADDVPRCCPAPFPQ
jgi:hypothetical protein